MKKTALLLLLLACALQAGAQKPSAINDKVFKEKIVSQMWGSSDTVSLTFKGFYITKDSVFSNSMNFINGGSAMNYAYKYIQIKENIFELSLFHKNKLVGYLYGYMLGRNRLSVLLAEERMKISRGFTTGWEWVFYEKVGNDQMKK